MASISCMTNQQTEEQVVTEPKRRPRNAVLVATAIEVHCPHCEAAQPAPGGSEFCEVREAKEMCDGAVKPCVACDEPIRMIWHDKVQVI